MEFPEIIDVSSDEHFMREALRQAARAAAEEEVPIGAVIVFEKHVIARAHNQVEMLKDATAHAEMLAITQAAQAIGDWRLEGCTLYVTKEPCSMCAGAMVLSRIGRLVFGAADSKSGAAGGMINLVDHPKLNHRLVHQGGVLTDQCTGLLKDFFLGKRKNSTSS
jgi:tRNA(adenine34) deaminase